MVKGKGNICICLSIPSRQWAGKIMAEEKWEKKIAYMKWCTAVTEFLDETSTIGRNESMQIRNQEFRSFVQIGNSAYSHSHPHEYLFNGGRRFAHSLCSR